MAYEKVLQKFPLGSKNNSTGMLVEKKERKKWYSIQFML